MRPLLILVGLRVRASLGSASSALMYFGLPAMLLLLTAGLFANGHPFERRQVALVGGAPELAARLESHEDLRAVAVASEEAGLGLLRSAAVAAVLAPGTPPRLHVAPREELFGRGLRDAALPRETALLVEPVPRFAYMRYLFPGLITWTVLVGGFLGMGYAMARYRRAQFLKKLSLLPISRAVFVGAQVIGRSAMALAQLAILFALAMLLLGLRAGPAGVALAALATLLGLLAFMGAGFALASRIHGEAALMDAANAISVILVLISEVFFPIDDLPGALRAAASALPSTQLARLLRAILLEGETGLTALAPGMIALAVWAAALFSLATATFRWHDD